jgi:hypothetical protein
MSFAMLRSLSTVSFRCMVVLLSLTFVVGCEQDVAVVAPPIKPAATDDKPLTDAELAARVDRAIQLTGERVLDVDVNNAWQVIHGILAYGTKLQMNVKGTKVSALNWLFAGNVMKGWDLYPGDKGLEAKLDPGSSEAQGHPDQWIGYFSQCGVGLDDKIVVAVGPEKKPTTFTMRDMIEQAKWSLREGQEATWTLMALAAYSSPDYLPIDGSWKARDGKEWTFEKIAEMEAQAGIEGAACGGAHRLYALTEALALYKKTGKPLTAGWQKAQALVDKSLSDAREYQQPDGGFSTNMFFRSGISADVDARINSTGHVFEVLAYGLSDEDLRSPWFTRAAQYLCKKIEDSKSIPVSCGGLYHGAHGLMIYRERRFGKPTMPAAN